jgi:ParB/Sulfiredoxin domain
MNKTTKYEIFKYLDRNRKLSKQHLKELQKSIEADNRLPENPIIVNEKLEIIDGQHRLEVAKNLGLPIYYVVAQEAGMDTVIRLQIQKGWSAMDYIINWEKAGKVDYEILHSFINYYRLPITLSVKLLGDMVKTKKSLGGGGDATEIIRNGNFKVKSLKKSQEFAERYKEVYNLIKRPFARSRPFILAIKELFECPEYEHERLLTKLKYYAGKLTPEQSVNEYLRDIERIYNLKAKVDIKLF